MIVRYTIILIYNKIICEINYFSVEEMSQYYNGGNPSNYIGDPPTSYYGGPPGIGGPSTGMGVDKYQLEMMKLNMKFLQISEDMGLFSLS